jgi:hypothetical protein
MAAMCRVEYRGFGVDSRPRGRNASTSDARRGGLRASADRRGLQPVHDEGVHQILTNGARRAWRNSERSRIRQPTWILRGRRLRARASARATSHGHHDEPTQIETSAVGRGTKRQAPQTSRPLTAHLGTLAPWHSSYFPFAMAPRNSALFLVLPIFDSSSSMASVGDSGVSTLRSTHTRFRSSFGMSSSSLRVPLF